jgi:hypothetical protein
MENSKTVAGLIGPTLIALAEALLINLGSISSARIRGGNSKFIAFAA